MIYAPHVLSKPPESPDLTAARARIAELEDWQRRAVAEVREYRDNYSHLWDEASREAVARLLQEATR